MSTSRWVFVLLLVGCLVLVGCGTLAPSTSVSPPANRITHNETLVKGGTAKVETTTITIKTPDPPSAPAAPVVPATPAAKPKEQGRAEFDRPWWDKALDWILPGSPAYGVETKLPNGQVVDVPPGSVISITTTKSESKNDDTETSIREGDTRGAGLRTNQAQKEKFETGDAGALNLGSGRSSPSTRKSSGGIFSASGGAMPPGWMYIIGGLVMAGGVAVIVFLEDTKGGVTIMVGGAAICLAGYVIPVYGGWILLALGLAAAGYFFFVSKKGKAILARLTQADEVIDEVIVAVQKGIEALPKPTLDADGKQVGPLVDFFGAMSKSMDRKVKEFVKKYKAEHGVG